MITYYDIIIIIVITVYHKEMIFMSSALVQFRTDDESKIKAMNICQKLGMDLQTYLRMCLSRLIQENGVPFSMKIEDNTSSKGFEALKQASMIAEENGISDISITSDNPLYEIDGVRRNKMIFYTKMYNIVF